MLQQCLCFLGHSYISRDWVGKCSEGSLRPNVLQRIRQQREAETSPATPRALTQEALNKWQEIVKVQGETEIVGFLDSTMEPALAINENPLTGGR